MVNSTLLDPSLSRVYGFTSCLQDVPDSHYRHPPSAWIFDNEPLDPLSRMELPPLPFGLYHTPGLSSFHKILNFIKLLYTISFVISKAHRRLYFFPSHETIKMTDGTFYITLLSGGEIKI